MSVSSSIKRSFREGARFFRIVPILLWVGTLFSCHFYFNNPADPAAEDYIGYDLIPGLSKTVPLHPAAGDEIVFPALQWTLCPGVENYGLEVATGSDFNILTTQYSNHTLKRTRTSVVSYDPASRWVTDSDVLPLWDLPAGSYWWRCNLKGEMTAGKWGDWSTPRRFTQKLRMKEMYWSWDESDPNGIKRGFRYFFDLHGSAEKEINFLEFNSETSPRYLESVVTLFTSEGKPKEELLFSSVDCEPEHLVEKRGYLYVEGARGRTEVKQKLLLTADGVVYPEPVLMEVDRYTYEAGESDLVASVTRHKVDRSTGEQTLYFESIYNQGLQVKTFFYGPSESEPGKLEVKYFYDLHYLEEHPDKPSRAEYYMRDAESGSMNYYDDYIIDYNLPEKSGGTVITLGGSASRSVDSQENPRSVSPAERPDRPVF